MLMGVACDAVTRNAQKVPSMEANALHMEEAYVVKFQGAQGGRLETADACYMEEVFDVISRAVSMVRLKGAFA